MYDNAREILIDIELALEELRMEGMEGSKAYKNLQERQWELSNKFFEGK